MAEPAQLTQHIESFVDSSRSPAQQAASRDAVVSLLKNNVLTIGSLVRQMEMYLTTTDHIIRARGILLVGEVLTCLSSKPLDDATVHSLITFFTDRLADWRALRGALVGCLALMKRKSSATVSCSDAKALVNSYLQNLQIQSLGQHDRKLCLELLECLLEDHPDSVASLGDHLVYGFCEAIDGEKDPQCLMLTFHIVETLAQLFPDPCGPIASYASDLFGILGCYFPIHFTHPSAEDVDVKRDDLSRALMLAFSSTPLFEPFAMPLLLEKLSSSLPSAKVESLKYLSRCLSQYGAERVAKHAGTIWSSLRDAICNSGEEHALSFSLESQRGADAQGTQIEREALSLLEKLIIQNNDLFLSLIIHDEEINMLVNTTTCYKIYNEIPTQKKPKLYAIGRILYVSAKTSVASCNKIFQSFFPRLMADLGLSVESASDLCCSNGNGIVCGQDNFGSLYICVELLGACRYLIVDPVDLKSQCVSETEMWSCWLQQFSTSLSKIFCSTLKKRADKADPNVHLAVKGLQTLSTLPGGYLLISKATFDNILTTLVSIIIAEFDETPLWKLALKGLEHIGSFLDGCDESEKTTGYVDIVVDKIVSSVFCDDFTMPFQLKLKAISVIGKSGQKYMLEIFLKLEESIHVNLANIYGNPKSAKIIIQLLECYHKELLPWIQKNQGFEEVLFRFVVNLWNQIENCNGFNIGSLENDLLDAMMRVMKFAVACCLNESQNLIVDKAYSVLSSSTSLLLKESLCTRPTQLEGLKHNFSSRDRWILSLFASVIIALRPQTHIPNIRMVLHLFMTTLLHGYVTAAQAFSSLLNKLDLNSNEAETSVGCTFDEAMDMIFGTDVHSSDNSPLGRTSTGNEMNLTNICRDGTKTGLLQNNAIVGLAWIGKGLLMRGHEKVNNVTMVLLECLLSNGKMDSLSLQEASTINSSEQTIHTSLMKYAADAFQILMSDSELCLDRQFHATVRPLYKQRFFSTMMPILQPLIIKSDSSLSRSMLLRAFVHIITNTPVVVILNDAKNLIPLLLEGLILLSKDVSDKDTLYDLLLVLSGILTDKNGQEVVVDNTHTIVNCLLGLITYPHKMLVRETAIQCLVAMPELPHTRIYPLRIQVLQAMAKALDDPKRAVRVEAVRCRQAWASIASRSLHF